MAFYVANKNPSEHTIECLTNHEILSRINAGRQTNLAWIFCPTTNEERALGFDATVANYFKLLVVQHKSIVAPNTIGIEINIRQLWLLCWLFPRVPEVPYAFISFGTAGTYQELNDQHIHGTYFQNVLFFDIWSIFDALCDIAYGGLPPPPPNFVVQPPFPGAGMPPVDFGHVRLDSAHVGYQLTINNGNKKARAAIAVDVMPVIFPPPIAPPPNPIPVGARPVNPVTNGVGIVDEMWRCHFGITPQNYAALLNQNFPPGMDAVLAAPDYFGPNVFLIPFP